MKKEEEEELENKDLGVGADEVDGRRRTNRRKREGEKKKKRRRKTIDGK